MDAIEEEHTGPLPQQEIVQQITAGDRNGERPDAASSGTNQRHDRLTTRPPTGETSRTLPRSPKPLIEDASGYADRTVDLGRLALAMPLERLVYFRPAAIARQRSAASFK